ncbi:TATA box-binding protein-like 2 (TBP-like 2) (TATA box-binding protein-related factor 3) (TBP-related factor 3) [Durusdinium trenchii]|uniref:TATA box-binding protein-like 2 (TBP-like 2) (TATA box-binding protein-related factor 3) (TBP-related factor 3) n=1 Tax=Durusdinium trenchii TaxID=1381693 RepID=A0ABP0K3F9_9DINO
MDSSLVPVDPFGRSVVRWPQEEDDEEEVIPLGEESTMVHADAMEELSLLPALGDDVSELVTRVRVRHLTASFRLGIPLDLKQLASQAPNAELRQRHTEKGQRLVLMGLTAPRWTGSLRSDGRVQLFAPHATEEQARLMGKKLARIVRRVHCAAVTFKDWQVQCMSVTANLPFSIDLNHSVAKLLDADAGDGLRLTSETRSTLVVEVKDLGNLRVHVSQRGLLMVYTRDMSVAVKAFQVLAGVLQASAQWWSTELQVPDLRNAPCPMESCAENDRLLRCAAQRVARERPRVFEEPVVLRTGVALVASGFLEDGQRALFGGVREHRRSRCAGSSQAEENLEAIREASVVPRRKKLLATCRMGQLVFWSRRFLSLRRYGSYYR